MVGKESIHSTALPVELSTSSKDFQAKVAEVFGRSTPFSTNSRDVEGRSGNVAWKVAR